MNGSLKWLFKCANPASFCLFSSLSHYNFNNTNYLKSIDGVLGIRTRAAGLQAQTIPQSYGGRPQLIKMFGKTGTMLNYKLTTLTLLECLMYRCIKEQCSSCRYQNHHSLPYIPRQEFGLERRPAIACSDDIKI